METYLLGLGYIIEVMMMEFFNRSTCNSVSHTHPIMIICQLPLVTAQQVTTPYQESSALGH